MNKLSNRLAYLRKKKRNTLKEMSQDLGDIKEETISRYEHGRREPKQDTLIKIANYFDCSVDYLLGRTDQKHNIEKSKSLNFFWMSD